MNKTTYLLTTLIIFLSILPTYASSTKSIEIHPISEENIFEYFPIFSLFADDSHSVKLDLAYESPMEDYPDLWTGSRNGKAMSRSKRQKRRGVPVRSI